MALSFEESKKKLSSLAATPAVMSLSSNDESIAAYESWDKPANADFYIYYENGDYYDEKISTVDENKNITLNNEQINLTQEKNSQYIPFEIPRYYDGFDLTQTELAIYWVNKNGDGSFSIPVDVYCSADKIRFAWLVNEEVTYVAGKVKFEIQGSGKNSLGQEYLWKTKSNDGINVIQALQFDTFVKPDESWQNSFVQRIAEEKEAAEAAATSAQNVLNQVSTIKSQTQTIKNETAAIKAETQNLYDSLQDGLATEAQSAVEAAMGGYYTNTEVDELITGVRDDIPTVPTNVSAFANDAGYATTAYVDGKAAEVGGNIPTKLSQLTNDADLATAEYVDGAIARTTGTLVDGEGNALTVEAYVQQKVDEVDVSEQLGELGINEDGTTKTVVQYVTEAIERQDITGKLGNYYTKEETYSSSEIDDKLGNVTVDLSDYAKSEEVYNKDEIDAKLSKLDVDVNVDLSDYYTKTEIDTSLKAVSDNTVTNATDIITVKNDIAALQASLGLLEGDNENLIIQYDEVGSILHLYEKDEDGDITIIDGDEQIKVKEISSTIITGAGGGGGSSLVSTVKLSLKPDGESSSTVLYGSATSLNYNLSTRKAKETQDEAGNDVTVYEEAIIAGDITLTLYRNNVYLTHFTVTKASAAIQGGSVDISEYVTLGSQVFTITASYVEQLGSDGESITVRSSSDWAVNAVNLKLTNLPDSTWETTPKYGSTTFSYTPIGALEKTVYFKMDNKDPEAVVTSLNGTALTYNILSQTHGVHTLRVWCEGNVGGTTISTEVYEYVLMFVETGNETPIIRIKAPTTLEQYSSAYIYYNVFDPLNAIIDSVVIYDEDGVTLSSVESITSAEQKWEFRPLVVKNKTITIKYKEKTNYAIIEVTKFPYEINAVTGDLMVDFVPTGRTNSDVDYNIFKNNAYTIERDSSTGKEVQTEIPITWTLSDNFDWVNGGWKTDENGDTYFCIKSGTSVDINYNLFGTDGVVAKKDANGEYTIAGTGKEFKLVFKTTNVAQANTTWLQCVDVADKNSLGIRMEAQNAYIDSSLGTLEIPYVDDDIIEFDMNIVPITKFLDNGEPNLTTKTIPMVITYEDGTPVQPKVITSASTNFKQDTPKPITIGSEYCDVHIYRMKVYERYLEDKEILTNFIADARSGVEMAKRYVRNDIYPIEDAQKITPESVATACPDLKVYVLSAPYFTNDKGDKVANTTIRQLHNTGTKENPEWDINENWIATGATHNGQGTSSNEYGYSGRNLEFNMKKATITLGDNVTVVKEIQLSPTSYPTNYLNFKINIASSENANNALLQKRYDRYLPYTTLASLIDNRKKNSMEFFNCVVFIQETGDVSTHREFDNCDINFYGIGNIGDSKKTDASRVNDVDDPNEFCVEIMDWNRELSSFPVNTMVNAMRYTTDPDTKEKVYTWAKDENLGILYELINGEYVLTKDATVDLTKTYYVDALENDDFSEDYTYGFRYIQNEWDEDDDPDYKEKNEAFQKPLRQKWIEFYKFITRDLTTNGKEDPNKVNAWKSEFSNWFILDAALYYYLYTLRYTMVDNRAKNSFWHWGKHYITFEEAMEKGINVYDEDKNLITDASNLPSKFYDVNGNEIKNINSALAAINNGYRMEFWMYDNDTALGIDNAGKLEIPYGVEDNDVDSAGVPYFRANDSLVFTRIAKYFAVELENAWHNTEINPVGKAFDSIGFINEFDAWQEEFPEELWRLDYERKYKRTYVGGTGEEWNGALPQSNKSDITSTRFLTEMMNGRKKYQRRCFERNQEIYMSSKFKGEVNISDTITLRGTGSPTNKVVEPNFALTITPFSKMYVNLYNSTSEIYYHQKCEAGVTIVPPIEYPNTNLDFIYIRGASQIQSLGDLSPMYLQTAELTPGAKLKTITLGNATDGYSNDSLQTLQIGASNKLLEELDIRNLSNLSNTVLPVTNIPSLKRVYAQGSNITEARFANNGLLEEAYLPATITRLELRNLHYLNTISLESYNNLLYLTATNCSGTMSDIVLNIINQSPDLREVRATDINWELDDTTALERLYSLIKTADSPEVVLEGTVHVPIIREYFFNEYAKVWPKLTVVSDRLILQYPVTFKNYDGSTLIVQYVDENTEAVDPIENGDIPTPTRESSVSTVYKYAGWDTTIEGVEINGPKTITATYTESVRTYTIKYVSNGVTMQESTDCKYGDYIEYTKDKLPTLTHEENYNGYYLFKDWDKSGYVDGDKTINALFDYRKYTDDYYTGKVFKDLQPVDIYMLSKRGIDNTTMVVEDGNDYSIRVGHDVDYTDIESQLIVSDKTSFDGTNYIDTGIELFKEDRDFTLALDYEFLSGNTTNATLAQCFKTNGSIGFRLFYNSNIKLAWSSTTSSASPATVNNREMLVLRHKSGDSKLYVYKSNLSSSSILTETLTTTRDTFTDSTLVLGCAKDDAGDYAAGAIGDVHWCKVWYKDLGDSVCRKLANWTHEKIDLEVCGRGRFFLAEDSSKKCMISFLATHLLERAQKYNTTSTTEGGWATSYLNKFLNSRLYEAMPTQTKLLLKQVSVWSSNGAGSTEVSSSNCYITIPAVIELTTSSTYYAVPYINEMAILEGQTISYMTSSTARRRAYDNGTYASYLTRSPSTSYTSRVCMIYSDGSVYNSYQGYPTTNYGVLIEISF